MSVAQRLSPAEQKRSLRMLKLLQGKKVQIERSSNSNTFLLVFVGERSIKCQRNILASWFESGFVQIQSKQQVAAAQSVSITDVGIAYLVRAERGSFADQHRHIECQTISIDGVQRTALRNTKESPLSALFHRKANQKAWLDVEQFDAGERLRSDFEFSQLTPRITASWDPTSNFGNKGGGRKPSEGLTDRVLGARQRLNNAIDAVGPEFSAILLDVCCFLKGMEQIERERQWPRRSAKLLLKAALAALARHYSPEDNAVRRSKIQHWGAGNYRPNASLTNNG